MKFARLLLCSALLAAACRHESELPKLFPVPNAKLVTQTGAPVQLDAMKGSVTVYDFIFTNCAGTCPLMSNSMKALTKQIDPRSPVRFVSISVDPTRDNPEALRKYAARFGNDSRWLFLTGDRDAIVKLSVEGFKLAAGGDPQPGAEPLLHSSKLVVADKHGIIREYYGATSDDAVAHVAATVKELVQD
jgi:protein SCO1/2